MWTSKLPRCDFIWRSYFWEPPQLCAFWCASSAQMTLVILFWLCHLFGLIILCITPLHPCFYWSNDKFLLQQMLYWTLTTPSLLITTPRGPSTSIHSRCYIRHWQLHHYWSLHQEVHQPAYTADAILDTDNSITTDRYTKRSISQHTQQLLYWTLTTPSLLITTPRGPSTSIHIHYLNSILNTTILYHVLCFSKRIFRD